jgi:hypothetical protein
VVSRELGGSVVRVAELGLVVERLVRLRAAEGSDADGERPHEHLRRRQRERAARARQKTPATLGRVVAHVPSHPMATVVSFAEKLTLPFWHMKREAKGTVQGNWQVISTSSC